MKWTLSLVASALALGSLPHHAAAQALSDPVVAAPDPEALFTSKDPKLNRNKQAALHIVRDLLEAGHWQDASKYLTERYIQHNPLAASGLAGVVHFFVDVAKVQPKPIPAKMKTPVVAVQAEGDLVTVLTVRTLPVPGKPGTTYTTTWFDTWRFVDGKADEHWDPATLPEPAATSVAYLGTAEDRAAIERLMWSYDRALDRFDADAYAAKFTPDGAFGQVKGRDALHKMVADLKTSQDDRRAKGADLGAMHHVTTNQWLEFVDPNHARYHYYHMTVFGTFGTPGQKDAPMVMAAGNGVDDLVKTDGQWLIAMRDVAPKTE